MVNFTNEHFSVLEEVGVSIDKFKEFLEKYDEDATTPTKISEDLRCDGIVKKTGSRCANKAKVNGKCGVHKIK
jgi:hypothetical protein